MQGKDPKIKTTCPAEAVKNKVCKNGNSGHSSKRYTGEANRSIDRASDKSSGDSGFDSSVTQEFADGTDSGVEVVRALSSSGSNSDRFTPIQSCGSSLLSYSSEPEIDRGSECGSESSDKNRHRKENDSFNCWRPKKNYSKGERTRKGSRILNGFDGEATSESCSETSSIHEHITCDQLSQSLDYSNQSPINSGFHENRKYENGKSNLRRSESVTRSGKTYEKPFHRSHSGARTSASSGKVNISSKSFQTSRNTRINELCEIKGGDGSTSVFSQRGQTSGARIRVSSEADPTRRSNVMSSSVTSPCAGAGISDSNALDKYGTLPRRLKKNSPESVSAVSGHRTSLSRSNSVTREPSLNRAATLRNQHAKEKGTLSNDKSLPPYPKGRKGIAGKTIIYHESGVQTVITGEDISNVGSSFMVNGKNAEICHKKKSKDVQTEGKDRLKKLEEDYAKQSEELVRFTRENEQLKAENRKILVKISKLLGRSNSTGEEPDKKELEELERHFQVVGLTVIKQQKELSELRRFKAIAHRDLEKSLAAQKNLLQQQQEIEEEYSELQEFLQAEKIALSESLLDTETELKRLNGEIAKKEFLLEQQQEECKHLVRICEQRRQENLSLEAKLAGLDQRSRDVLVQQGAAVSAAAVALSGLGARLDTLVEQLSTSFNISEKDLEDIIFYNEAYSKSEDNSPGDVQSDISREDQKHRGVSSFLQIILGAIRNAAESSLSKKNCITNPNSDRLLFFDAETEPCLNLETALDDNTLSNCTDFEANTAEICGRERKEEDLQCDGELNRSDSLQNLSDAILNRQAVEKNERDSVSLLDQLIPVEVNSLVDEIIEVDNSVTKLLKVIKIIQGESEKKMAGLEEERALLMDRLEQKELNKKKMENNLEQLQRELIESRRQLNLRISQLEEAKALCGDNQRMAAIETEKRFAVIENALGALNSVQDLVNKCPPLAQLRRDLQDCGCENSPCDDDGDDVNANSGSGKGNPVPTHFNGAVLTTAI